MTWLSVEPLDTIMVRDGRQFGAGDDAVAAAAVPSPSTFGGVVKAVRGRNVQRILGPAVHIADRPVFPAPADIVREEVGGGARVCRLAPRERARDEVTDLDPEQGEGRLAYALYGEGKLVEEWLTGEGLAAWLRQDEDLTGEISDDRVRRRYFRDRVWHRELRVGIARDAASDTVLDGMFYSAEHLRPEWGLGFVVGCEDPESISVPEPTVVPLGGQGRLATVRCWGGWGSPFPEAPDGFPDGRVAVYLATPALVRDVRWRPPGTSARLCAFAVTGPHPVATASPGDMRTSRRLMWTVPAGSVYYLKFDSETEARDWSADYHGKLLPGVSTKDNPVVTAGFGTCLTGRW